MRIEDLKHSLTVSCQPVPGGPMDNAEAVVGFALAAIAGGAKALRIESLPYLRAVRQATDAPIVGIIKEDREDTEVRITPLVEQAVALAEAGADIVAFDATRRPRPASVPELIAAIKARGKLTMADCSDLEDARQALAAGVDIIGSTLSGYTGGPMPVEPDFPLIAAMAKLTLYVVAEGRIRTPAQAAEALRCGAWTVVVGSAITRTEHATAWFREAVEHAARAVEREPVLAIDIGGTKTSAALTRGIEVLEEISIPTDRTAGPDGWVEAIAERARDWRGKYASVGAAVTGLALDQHWSAMNPATLPIPDDYPLAARLTEIFGTPALIANDAQAAAWGEYRFGAGEREDLVFLTISTGIGGGVVINGRPLLGLAGHFGLLRSPSADGVSPFENEVSGRWIAQEAARAGHDVDAQQVFAAAANGNAPWAEAIVAASARKVALLCQDLQLVFDPKRIVIGGGIGLAPGYLDRVRAHLPQFRSRLRPRIVPARLGVRAGLIGVADLAATSL
ncbi:MAG TPA: putative N-acetylmannosamine-6-phosphate 2-epimerase [Devosiaceae bacterium]|nr:putative N-acetylmannosamine-6-phosphate 2-epimerase [Devosiaceae bacterium]